jgi:tricorn protease
MLNALDVLTRRPYLTMTVRGMPSAPGRSVLGQRALESPTILVTNEHSLSDAEDFTEGYRHLKLGKVVGQPTSGWIIYTSNVQLVDGSGLRIPFHARDDCRRRGYGDASKGGRPCSSAAGRRKQFGAGFPA